MSKPTPQDPAMPKTETPARTGACPFCLRGHLLRARGYAREVAEDPTREWERDNLIENLLLAGDHAEELGDGSLAATIRSTRHSIEDGADPLPAARALYDIFKKQYFPSTPSTPSTEPPNRPTAEPPDQKGGEF